MSQTGRAEVLRGAEEIRNEGQPGHRVSHRGCGGGRALGSLWGWLWGRFWWNNLALQCFIDEKNELESKRKQRLHTEIRGGLPDPQTEPGMMLMDERRKRETFSLSFLPLSLPFPPHIPRSNSIGIYGFVYTGQILTTVLTPAPVCFIFETRSC